MEEVNWSHDKNVVTTYTTPTIAAGGNPVIKAECNDSLKYIFSRLPL